MKYGKAFLAGFLSTLIFHQGILNILNIIGAAGSPAYSLSPTWPMGVPSVLSLSFFGGLWGMVMVSIIDQESSERYWIKSFLFGAIAPTLVAFFIVFPMKGLHFNLKRAMTGVILNGAWGLGCAWIFQMLKASFKRIRSY